MEYLDGETLADRLTTGALPLDEALKIAIQIADALAAAHRHGIVHRDLKPGNVMLTKAGAKLLDFGLAKASGVIASAGLSMLPTTPPNLTAQGTILGTFQYMAPEQLEGQDADARSDIFAFGSVLYEMLTGRKAFEGKSQASLIGAILEREPPPVSSLQPLSPPALDRIVRTCLAKAQDERWQSAGDLTRELTWIADVGSRAGASSPVVAPRKGPMSRVGVAWTVAALAAVVAASLAVAGVLVVRRTARDPGQIRFDVPTPPTTDPGSFALSSDGRQLAFVATIDSAPRLWVRPLNQVTAQPLAGTEGARDPFWSPDGTAVGFFADGKLKRIDLGGGVPQVLADAPAARGGTWSANGVILFGTSGGGGLMRVPATGGTPVVATRLAPGQAGHRWPQFLPDGRSFLFLMALGRSDTRGVYIGTLEGGEPVRVLASESAAVFAPPDALLLVRQDVLVAYHFDLTRGAVSGDPMPLAQGVGTDPGARGAFAVSATGVLAHRAGGAERRQLVWVDRAGAVRSSEGPVDEAALANPELAPDGRRIAVNRTVQGNIDVWLIEVGRGRASRFTFDASIDAIPLWSPDGSRLAFRSTRNGTAGDLFEKPTSGAGDEQPLLVTAESKVPLAWSPDGRFLLYGVRNAKTGTDLWALPLVGERKPFPIVQTLFDEAAGQFSPDGRWVAYQSNESGQLQIYVRLFPGPGGQRQVSTTGGSQPRWRPNGKELFYVAPDSRLMAVPIGTGADRQTTEVGAPAPLFPTRLASGISISPLKPQYAVASDGRFLMNVAAEGATAPPITVVLNWAAALKP
jgi:Tol biopolymer transport system component